MMTNVTKQRNKDHEQAEICVVPVQSCLEAGFSFRFATYFFKFSLIRPFPRPHNIHPYHKQ